MGTSVGCQQNPSLGGAFGLGAGGESFAGTPVGKTVFTMSMVQFRLTDALRWLVAAVMVVGAACGDSAPQGPDEPDGLIELDVRVHLLESESDAVRARSTEARVEQLIDGANEIWRQANIRWNVESIVSEQAGDPTEYERLVRGQVSDPTHVLLALVSDRGVLEDGWNVYFVQDLGVAPGIYVTSASRQVLFVQETPPPGEDAGVAGPRILAHELGHSLSLAHVACSAAGNLMAPGCPSGVRTQLTAIQITQVRGQARTGRPFIF